MPVVLHGYLITPPASRANFKKRSLQFSLSLAELGEIYKLSLVARVKHSIRNSFHSESGYVNALNFSISTRVYTDRLYPSFARLTLSLGMFHD